MNTTTEQCQKEQEEERNEDERGMGVRRVCTKLTDKCWRVIEKLGGDAIKRIQLRTAKKKKPV